MLRSYHLPGTVLAATVIPEVAAEAGVPISYYAATCAVVLGVAAILRGWKWVRGEVREEIAAALELHDARDQARHTELAADLRRLSELIERR